MNSTIQNVTLLIFMLFSMAALQAQDCGCGPEPVPPNSTSGGSAVPDWNPCTVEVTGFKAKLAAWQCCRKECAEAERERQRQESKERYEAQQAEKERNK